MRRTGRWIVLVTLMAAMVATTASAGGPAGVALPGFPEMTGSSGESQAVLLNPAAATGLQEAALGLWAMAPSEEDRERPPVYALTLLDPGITLAGGLVATLAGAEEEQVVGLSYTVAARLGSVGLGVRPVWTYLPSEEGVWSVDAGFAWHPAPWISLGAAALELPVGDAAPEDPPWALGGLTLTITRLSGTVLEGTQLSAGLRDPDLKSSEELHPRAGLRLALGQRIRLLAGYEHGSTARTGTWTGGLTLLLEKVRLHLGYPSDGVYQAGFELNW